MNQLTIDLNADLGEGYPFDAELMKVVTSSNICSGAYIDDAAPVRKAISLAIDAGVRIGIHVGYPDIENFGRRAGYQSPKAFESSLQRQVDQFLEMAVIKDAAVQYLKPHGALYHDLIPESDLWEILLKVCDMHKWPLLHLAHSDILSVAATVTGAFHEAFVDRRYASAQALIDRSAKGAVLTDSEEVLAQAVSLVNGEVALQDGTTIQLTAQSLCLHGDTEGALFLGQRIRTGIEDADFNIEPFL